MTGVQQAFAEWMQEPLGRGSAQRPQLRQSPLWRAAQQGLSVGERVGGRGAPRVGSGGAGRNQGQLCLQRRPPIPCNGWDWTLQHAPADEVTNGLECGFRHVRGRFLLAGAGSGGSGDASRAALFARERTPWSLGQPERAAGFSGPLGKGGRGWPRRPQTVLDPRLTRGGPPKSGQTQRRQESRRMGVGTESDPAPEVSVQK